MQRRRGLFAAAAAIAALTSTAARAAPAPLDPAALDHAVEEAAERLLAAPVREGRTSAAVITYVRDGAVRVEGAWGYEDVERRHPVGFARSAFEIASLSKVFTAVTLAVIKDRGLVRGYADPANAYLHGWQLPAPSGPQITLDQLVTHSAGLNDAVFGMFSASPPTREAESDDLARRMPGYFAPPGAVVSYSSFGIDVLGQVIAGATGEPFPRAVEDHLLRPMQMDGTHVGDRVDAAHDVVPYEPWHPAPEPRIYHVPSAFPSIGITTTGKDAQRLMLALLEPGGRGVITPAVQDDVFRVHEADGDFGAAHGLVFELFRHGGRVVLQHGGISKNVSCYLALARELRAGLFYCHTDPKPSRGAPADARGPGRDAVRDAMSEMLRMGLTDAPAETPLPVAWKDSWGEYVGSYLSVYRGYEGVLRLRSLLHPDRVRVSRGARGLRVGDRDGLTEIAPGVFGAPDYEDTIAFHRDPRTGRMRFSRATGFNTYEQPPLLDDARVFLPLLAAAFLVAASGLAFALPRWMVAGSRHARPAALAFAAAAVTGAGILYGFHALGEPYSVGTAWPILTVRVLGFLIVPAAALLSALAWRAFRRTRGPLPRLCRLARVHLAALAVAAWTAVAVLVDFGLIGFSRLL